MESTTPAADLEEEEETVVTVDAVEETTLVVHEPRQEQEHEHGDLESGGAGSPTNASFVGRATPDESSRLLDPQDTTTLSSATVVSTPVSPIRRRMMVLGSVLVVCVLFAVGVAVVRPNDTLSQATAFSSQVSAGSWCNTKVDIFCAFSAHPSECRAQGKQDCGDNSTSANSTSSSSSSSSSPAGTHYEKTQLPDNSSATDQQQTIGESDSITSTWGERNPNNSDYAEQQPTSSENTESTLVPDALTAMYGSSFGPDQNKEETPSENAWNAIGATNQATESESPQDTPGAPAANESTTSYPGSFTSEEYQMTTTEGKNEGQPDTESPENSTMTDPMAAMFGSSYGQAPPLQTEEQDTTVPSPYQTQLQNETDSEPSNAFVPSVEDVPGSTSEGSQPGSNTSNNPPEGPSASNSGQAAESAFNASSNGTNGELPGSPDNFESASKPNDTWSNVMNILSPEADWNMSPFEGPTEPQDYPTPEENPMFPHDTTPEENEGPQGGWSPEEDTMGPSNGPEGAWNTPSFEGPTEPQDYPTPEENPMLPHDTTPEEIEGPQGDESAFNSSSNGTNGELPGSPDNFESASKPNDTWSNVMNILSPEADWNMSPFEGPTEPQDYPTPEENPMFPHDTTPEENEGPQGGWSPKEDTMGPSNGPEGAWNTPSFEGPTEPQDYPTPEENPMFPHDTSSVETDAPGVAAPFEIARVEQADDNTIESSSWVDDKTAATQAGSQLSPETTAEDMPNDADAGGLHPNEDIPGVTMPSVGGSTTEATEATAPQPPVDMSKYFWDPSKPWTEIQNEESP